MPLTRPWSTKSLPPPELEAVRCQQVWRQTLITLEQLEQFARDHRGVDQLRGQSCKYARKLIEGDYEGRPAYLSFWEWLRNTSGAGGRFDFAADGLIEFNLAQDYYLMWRLCGAWMQWRGIRGDNGWWRHGIRIIARYQYYKIVGEDNWSDPCGRQRAPKRSRPTTSRYCDASGVGKAELTAEAETAEGGNAGVVAVGVPLGLPALTRSQQLESYCGNNPDLVAYAERRYGRKPGGMPTSAVQRWYRSHPGQLPEHLRGRRFGPRSGDVQVCHIISVAKGGADYVWNYGIYAQSVNSYFGEFMPREWSNYIGKHADQTAKDFARWVAKKAAACIDFGSFNPISDRLLARGR